MKKALPALLAAAAIAAPLTSHAAGDGTVNFSGSIKATTCTVTNGGAVALDVTLPPVAATALTPTGGLTNFSLTISNCTGNETTATTYFEPSFAPSGTINQSTGNLVNTSAPASGPANVELQLLNAGGTNLNLAQPQGSQGVAPATITNGGATANFAVQYIHTDASTINPGTVTSSVTYSMIYN
jgi:major type 1 subunit fimbrin (pilin)